MAGATQWYLLLAGSFRQACRQPAARSGQLPQRLFTKWGTISRVRPEANHAPKHLRPPRSRRCERTVVGLGTALLMAALVCWSIGGIENDDSIGDVGSGLFVLGLAVVLGGLLNRLRFDPSEWKGGTALRR